MATHIYSLKMLRGVFIQAEESCIVRTDEGLFTLIRTDSTITTTA